VWRSETPVDRTNVCCCSNWFRDGRGPRGAERERFGIRGGVQIVDGQLPRILRTGTVQTLSGYTRHIYTYNNNNTYYSCLNYFLHSRYILSAKFLRRKINKQQPTSWALNDTVWQAQSWVRCMCVLKMRNDGDDDWNGVRWQVIVVVWGGGHNKTLHALDLKKPRCNTVRPLYRRYHHNILYYYVIIIYFSRLKNKNKRFVILFIAF